MQPLGMVPIPRLPHQHLAPAPCLMRAAFTLIELLIAIAVAAILIALLASTLRSVTAKAQTANCSGNLKNLGAAILLYAAENDGRLPTMFRGLLPAAESSYWNYTIGPYLNLDPSRGAALNALRCPAADSSDFMTYGVNYPTVVALDYGQSGASWLDIGSTRLNGSASTGTFLLSDADSPAVYSPLIWNLNSDIDGDGINDSNSSFKYNRVKFRHDGKANFFLMNGAIVLLTPKQWAKNEGGLWGELK